ncbi:MAG: Ig-like domain-containing protein, partial [Candidatus Parcubacteria bacterium]|nr:Ig-like domain-containing protein [Candidatus Parcubacteria bacterium]
GLVAILIILYGGFLYMTSQGNPEVIDKAKKVLYGALIGLIICLCAFAIVQFIITAILGGGGEGAGGPGGYGGGGGALGAGIIESHYPARDANDIPRNTKIAITFKEALCLTDLVTGTGINAKMNTAKIKIYPTPQGNASPVYVTDVNASNTADLKTFVFKPVTYLGSPQAPMRYTVELTEGLRKFGCTQPAFGVFKSYQWNFTVSTVIDNTPPQIKSVIPYPAELVDRNNIVQINFSEAIDPMTLRGVVQLQGGNNVTVGSLQAGTYNYINVCKGASCSAGNNFIAGEFRYSNQYKTVEFITNDLCGKNSCGGNVFCLPALADIAVLVKAASLVNSTENTALFPYNGLIDMADNSFDGNLDGKSTGPSPTPYNFNTHIVNGEFVTAPGQGDDAIWEFKTTDKIDLLPPQIRATVPGANIQDVDPDGVYTIDFDKVMMSSTLKPNGNYDDGAAADNNAGMAVNPLKNGLQGYYRFTTSADNITNDDSGRGNNGLLYSASATIVNGELNVIGSANSYVSTQLKVLQTPGSTATFCAWANPRSANADGGNDLVSTDNGGYDWAIDTANGYWRLAHGENYWNASNKFPVKLNQWQYVCGVFDSNNVYLYVDNIVAAFGLAPEYDTSANFFTIGRNPSYPAEVFDGKIDSVVVYNRALSSEEITALYNLGKDGDVLTYNGNVGVPADLGTGRNYITLIQSAVPSGKESGYWIEKEDYYLAGLLKTQARMKTSGLGENLRYGIKVSSDVLDIKQNCYMPCSDNTYCFRVPGGKPGEYLQPVNWQGSYPTCNIPAPVNP